MTKARVALAPTPDERIEVRGRYCRCVTPVYRLWDRMRPVELMSGLHHVRAQPEHMEHANRTSHAGNAHAHRKLHQLEITP